MARRLFERARTPEEMSRLSAGEIDKLIGQSTFHERKAVQIRELAVRVVEELNGELPCDEEILLSFSGVGPKCAHLVLGIACGAPFISVDIHVHRVTNRWGYASAATPGKTMAALEAKLPKRYWIEINDLLVNYGQRMCTPVSPFSSRCRLAPLCGRVGVARSR